MTIMDEKNIVDTKNFSTGLHAGIQICLWTFGLGLALLILSVIKLRNDSYWPIVLMIEWGVFPLIMMAGLTGGIVGSFCLAKKVNNMFWVPLSLALLNIILAACVFFIRIGYIAIGRL